MKPIIDAIATDDAADVGHGEDANEFGEPQIVAVKRPLIERDSSAPLAVPAGSARPGLVSVEAASC
jgi:hypothetical protein